MGARVKVAAILLWWYILGTALPTKPPIDDIEAIARLVALIILGVILPALAYAAFGGAP